MIENEAELESATEAVALLYKGLRTLRQELKAKNAEHAFQRFAEGPLDELMRLQGEIDAYLMKDAADVWIHLVGPEIVWGDAPTSAITAIVDGVRKGVQSVTEYRMRGAVGTKPSREVRDACDLRLVGLGPGSVRVGVALPKRGQADLEAARDAGAQAWLALSDLLAAAEWAAGDEQAKLPADAADRRLLLQAVSPLVPREGGGISKVGFLRKGAPRAFELEANARERIEKEVAAPESGVAVTLSGIVREIDLDEQFLRITLEGGKSERRCHFTDEQERVVLESLDRTVRVKGTERRRGKRRAREVWLAHIEVVEDEVSDEGSR